VAQNSSMVRVESGDGSGHATVRARLAAMRAAGRPFTEQDEIVPSARTPGMVNVYYRTYATKDDVVGVACVSPGLQRAFMEVLGLVDGAPRGAGRAGLERHYAGLAERCEKVLASRTAAEWKPIFDKRGVPGAAVRFSAELFDDEQARANGFFHDLPHPTLGPVRVLAPPVKLDGGGFLPGAPTPAFASQTRAILGELGMLVVGELGHQVFRRAPAHGRGGSREASVHAAVVPGEPHTDQLEELGLDAGAAAVDVADEAPRGVEQAGPARHRQEQVVVLIGVPVPALQQSSGFVAQVFATRLRQEPALVGHGRPPCSIGVGCVSG